MLLDERVVALHVEGVLTDATAEWAVARFAALLEGAAQAITRQLASELENPDVTWSSTVS